MLKSRPKIRLRLPAEIHPGESLLGMVVVDSKRDTEVSEVCVELVGRAQSVAEGLPRRELIRLRGVLASDTVLEAGRSTYDFKFALPDSLPATYHGALRRIEYTMKVTASIPWWPDVEERFTVNVAPKPMQLRGKAKPFLFSTRPEGPRASEPHVEGYLAERRVVAGEEFEGSIAFSNIAYNTYRAVVLSFVGEELSGTYKREVQRFHVRLKLDEFEEGEAQPFRVRTPRRAAPTRDIKGEQTRLMWRLEVKVEITWKDDLQFSIPITILPSNTYRTTQARPRYAPISVGSARVQKVWRSVADATGLSFDGTELSGKRGQVTMRIVRHHRGEDGIFIAAELGFPDVGLHIEGGLKRGLFSRFNGLDIGAPEWQKEHLVRGREERQVTAFVRPVVNALKGFRVPEITDRSLTVELRDSGQSELRLTEFASTVKLAAKLIGDAKRSIPPPESMHGSVPKWSKLARQLRGELALGPMAIRSLEGGTPWSITTIWTPEGEALHTRVVLSLEHETDVESRITWSRANGISRGSQDKLSLEARERLRNIEKIEAYHALVIEERELVLYLNAPLGDPAPAGRALRSLQSLAASLRVRSGAYR